MASVDNGSRIVRAVLLACSLVAASATGGVASADEARRTDLRVEIVVDGKTLSFELTNVGKKDIIVPTGNLQSIWRDKGPLTIGLFDKTESRGRLIVPSETDLRLVKLRPGEGARLGMANDQGVRLLKIMLVNQLTFAMNDPRGKREKMRIAVEYDVSSFWGERFGLWQGKTALAEKDLEEIEETRGIDFGK